MGSDPESNSPTVEDDIALLEAVAAGDRLALSELWDRHGSLLLGLARRVLGNTEDAEEVLQEVFLSVWDQAGRYDPARSSPTTWLGLITRSRAIDRLRNRTVVDRTETAAIQEKSSLHASSEGPARVLDEQRRRRVREELASLPDEQREVLELAFFRGMTQREIAAATDTPLGTVKTRSLLAMKKLRTALRAEIQELL